MSTGRPQPSWGTGFARNPYQSDAPEQWRGLLFAVAPILGRQGTTLYDISGNGATTVLTNLTLATDWMFASRGLGLNYNASNTRGVVTHPNLHNVVPFTYIWYGMLRSAGQGNFGVMFAKGTTGNTFGTKRWVNVASGAIELTIQRATTIANYVASTGSTAFNVPLSIVTTCDANFILHCYVNGRETSYSSSPTAGSGTVTSDANTGMVLGDWATPGANGTHDGVLYDARMYNYAMDPAMIADLANDPLALYRQRARQVAVTVQVAAAAPTLEQQLAAIGGRQLIVEP